jgi:tripartite-type tricarboxylate transporter receptor subunit TctC
MAHISFDALAQEFPPKKTITIVVGFAPGGSADSAARVIAKKLSEDLGQNVIVDNKPGAGGNIAHAYTATAPTDGSVILFGSIGPRINRTPSHETAIRSPKRSGTTNDGRHISKCPSSDSRTWS